MFDFECAAFGDLALAAGGLGEDILAVVAGDDGLGMAEDDVGLVAAPALDIHEVGIGGGDESLELVGLALLFDGGVEQVSVHGLLIILR